jgi:hypothetical protein
LGKSAPNLLPWLNAVHLSKDQRGKNLAPSRKAPKVKELETLGTFAPLRETSYLNSIIPWLVFFHL